MRKVVFMGIICIANCYNSFITFDTELGYDKCVKIKEYQFGEDLLRIEPSQDNANIPTSVFYDYNTLINRLH